MAAKSDPRRTTALIFAPPAIALLMSLVWSTEFVRELENVTIDWRFKARAETDPAPDSSIALIGIGNSSLEAIGRWQDWRRTEYAKLLDMLSYMPPRVIAFDIFFPEESADPADDTTFADSLSLHFSAITGMYVDTSREAFALAEREPFPPLELFATKPFSQITGDTSKLLTGPTGDTPIKVIAESSWTGAVNFPPSDVDGMRREIPLIVMIGDEVFPSLVLQILIQWEEMHRDDVIVRIGESVTVPRAQGGEWVIPIDERGFHYLNYRDTSRFTIYELSKVRDQIKESAEEGKPWPIQAIPLMDDKIVLIGQSAEGLADFGPTPFRAEDPLFAVQATALDSILREDYIKRFPLWAVLTLWLVIAWMTLLSLRKAPIAVAIAIPILISAAFVLIAFRLFETQSVLLPFVLPVVGFVALHTTMIGDRLSLELKEKRYIRGVFGSYVAPDIVNQIISSGKTPELGGERVDITILFSDIQGFSTFSEQLTPEALVELMVEYLSTMTDIVTDSGGTLDKYIGDAIDAMFGAPLPVEGHPYKGVMAAIEMQRKQIELDEFWQKENRPEIVQQMRTRIGLNTGAAVVGNMGSKRRFNYTMMGDNVNLGARCESAAKTYGVYTMITEDTYQGARAVKDDIVYRYLDQIIVQGRTLPVKVYEVFEQRDRVPEKSLQCIELYEDAYRRYLNCDWDAAIEIFEKSSVLEQFQPERDHGIKTNPSRVMIARCGVMKVSPPEGEWDGVYRMTTK